MSLLTIVQAASSELGINAPIAVATSTDNAVIQLLNLLNREGKNLASRFNWTFLTNEASFTTVATESQGAIATIAPNYKSIINDTIYNRTLRRPVFGPLAPKEWQQQKAMNINGPWNQFRIRGANLLFIPAPTAGQACDFEYVSKNWATDSTGVTGKSAFSNDGDLPLLDEDLLIMGLVWRWRKAKGLEYQADFQECEVKIRDAMGKDGSKPVLDMGGNQAAILPGVFVPAGSWGV